MRAFVRKRWRLWRFVFLCWLASALSGCNVIGPASISQGRPAYNEVINRTNDEQILLALVRRRYGDSVSLLAVTNVAASLRFRANTGVQLGFDSAANYAGNLVPFSAGLAYEENPTISYTPVGGDLYMRRLMLPIPLDILVGLLRAGVSPGKNFMFLVKRINDLVNPDFLPSPSTVPDPRFSRLAQLIETLHRVRVLSFAAISAANQEFAIVVRGYAPSHLPEVRELMNLLSLSAVVGSDDIVVPMSLAVKKEATDSIAITTRSVAALINILTAAVEVPEEEVRSGRAIDYPPLGLVGRGVRIRRSEGWGSPDNASVRVKYRDAWYYIADTDRETKQLFRLNEVLWNVTIASSTTSQPAPVLTIPVGR